MFVNFNDFDRFSVFKNFKKKPQSYETLQRGDFNENIPNNNKKHGRRAIRVSKYGLDYLSKFLFIGFKYLKTNCLIFVKYLTLINENIHEKSKWIFIKFAY